jgi:hypothetical protein
LIVGWDRFAAVRGLIASTCAVITLGCAAYALIYVRAPIPAAAIGGVGGGPTTPLPETVTAPVPAENENANANENANVNAPESAASEIPHSAGVLGTLAWKSIDSGDYARAGEQASECLALDKTRSSCRSALVSSFTRRGLWDEAYPVLAKCAEEDPQNPTCLSALTMLHLRRGAKDDAKKVLDLLVATGDKSADSHVAAAEYALASQDNPAACESFRAACSQSSAYGCQRVREVCDK